jgi:hypothetical protein
MSKKPKKIVDLNSMPVSQRLKTAEELGSEVAKIMNSASRKANKMLAQYGFAVNVTADFCKLSESDSKDPQKT